MKMALVYIEKYTAEILQAKRKAVVAKAAVIIVANSSLVQEIHVQS